MAVKSHADLVVMRHLRQDEREDDAAFEMNRDGP